MERDGYNLAYISQMIAFTFNTDQIKIKAVYPQLRVILTKRDQIAYGNNSHALTNVSLWAV